VHMYDMIRVLCVSGQGTRDAYFIMGMDLLLLSLKITIILGREKKDTRT
jgi:hypothetical protein